MQICCLLTALLVKTYVVVSNMVFYMSKSPRASSVMYEILHKICQLCSLNLTFGLKVQLVCVNMELVSWHIGSSWLTALRLF